jgi:hypothetical protein
MYVLVNHATEQEQHILLDMLVPYLRAGSDTRKARFKIISSSKWFGLEFRNPANEQQLFSTWPGTESDKFGPKFILELGRGLESALARVVRQDLQFLASLFRSLHDVLQEAFEDVEISEAGQKQLSQHVQAFLAQDQLRDLLSSDIEADVVGDGKSLETAALLHAEALSKISKRDANGRRNFLPPDLPEFLTALYSKRLLPVSTSRDPVPDPHRPIVISVVRNEMAVIGEYLEHYRKAGIRRFAMIDNGSTDGTREFLSAQPDTDVYSQTDPFSTTRKQGWINQIILRYGTARWYLIADADEHVVFDGIERHGFADLVLRLESQHRRVARGMLVDMYGERPLGQLSTASDGLRREHRFFDPGPYTGVQRPEMMSCRGGMRRRVFSELNTDFNPELTKYPLLRLDPGEFVASPHYVWPPSAHLADPCVLGILHYKFTRNYSEKVADAVARKQYWNQSAEYAVYEAALARDPELVLKFPESAEYADSRSICSPGLIQSIDW